jgi:hypothetical protein
MNDEVGKEYIGDPTKKGDDALLMLTARIEELKDKYRNKIKNLFANYDSN